MNETPNYDVFTEARLNADHADALKISKKAGKVAKLATKMVNKGDQFRDISLPTGVDHQSLTAATNAELRHLQPGTEVKTYNVDTGSAFEGAYDVVELTSVDGQPVKSVVDDKPE